MNIQGIAGLTPEQIQAEIARGGKFVLYRYCVSLLVITLRRPTDIYFVKAGESRVMAGLPWTVLTFVMGWWGIPWGPIYSIQCLAKNLGGGEDVTAQIQRNLVAATPQRPPFIPGAMVAQPPPIPGQAPAN